MQFSMPMYRDFVPKAVRPWIYVFFAIVFQVSGGIYLGALNYIAGTTSFMTTDVTMIGMCGVVGVCIPFPFLFRFKFRYTNRQLLINAALVIAACNLLCMKIHSIPVLCALSFLAGFFKLCGTFECMSNIQLWVAPGRDFTRFFPFLYVIILGSMSLSSYVAVTLTYHLGSWEMMHWLMIGLLLLVVLTVFVFTRNVRIMPKLPMISMDWLGLVLWALVLLEGTWLFTYGEYYNWFDAKDFRAMCAAFVVTLTLCIGRMRRIRHPYISPKVFSHKGLLPVLMLFFVNEMLYATPKALQNVFTGSVLGYDPMIMTRFSLLEIVGTVAGCVFSVLCIKLLHLRYTRLLPLGTMLLLAYQLIMYFIVSPGLDAESLYAPTLIRTSGYAIFFIVLTIYMEEILPFPHFFMGLTICGFIRNGFGSSVASAIYAFSLRYYVADWNAASDPLSAAAFSAGTAATEPLLSGIKVLYGWSCFFGCMVLLLYLLYKVEPVRKTLKLIPSWGAVGRFLRIRLLRASTEEAASE